MQKKRDAPAIKAVHESQGSLANVMWHPVMMWSSLDNLLSNHETYSHENLSHMPHSAFSHPSELMRQNVFTCEEHTSSQPGHVSSCRHYLLKLSLLPPTSGDAIIFPPASSPIPHICLTPAKPLVDLSVCPCADSSLTHEWRQGRAC